MKLLYVHGIGDKPDEVSYKAELDASIQRYGLPVETRLFYWADLRREKDDIAEAVHNDPLSFDKFPRMRGTSKTLKGRLWSAVLHALDPAIRRVTRELVHDVYMYFYAPGMRNRILSLFGATVHAEKPDLILAHSLGGVIAYDYLASEYAERLASYPGHVLPSLVTMGSPLGNSWVQSQLGHHDWPAVDRWLNVYTRSDPVCWPDRRIGGDFLSPDGRRLIRDVEVPVVFDSKGRARSHAWYGYVTSEPVAGEIFKASSASRV